MASVDPARLVRSRLAIDRGALTLRGAEGNVIARHRGPVAAIAAGKAAAAMAGASREILGPSSRALAVAPGGQPASPGVRVLQGGHPLPTRQSLDATVAIWAEVERAPRNALILALVSGGASALLVRPVAGITLEDKAAVTRVLLDCGATIAEINTVRKHLSRVKGGGLARLAAPRPVWALILSDVVGDDLATIGSGPTVPDPTTYADALAIVDRYDLGARLPRAVLDHLRAGRAGDRPETPKPGDPCFRSAHSTIVGSNRTAIEAAASRATALGLAPLVIEDPVIGDTTVAATGFARTLIEQRRGLRVPSCVIAGGETTVRVRGGGRGGRNLEFALVVAQGISGVEGVHLLSAGTDGIDGPTDAAGAFASGATLGAARARGLDPAATLRSNDSYRFFELLGGLFRPGATGTNVMDLKLAVLEPYSV